MIDTRGAGGGSYPEPDEIDYIEKSIKVTVTFTSYINLEKNPKSSEEDVNYSYREQLKNMTIDELANETDTFEIEEWREV